MPTDAEYARLWRLRNAEHIRAYRKANIDRRRSQYKTWAKKHPDKICGYRKKHAPKNAEYARKWRKRNKLQLAKYRRTLDPKQWRAWALLNRAVLRGQIIRPDSCSRCNKRCTPEGHHPDYDKALEVVWLCKNCHKFIHFQKEH